MVQAADELGGYVIDREAGRGGHATVYQAHTAGRPDQRIALKVLRADHRSPADLSRLDREFQFAHRLGHPYLVTVYEREQYWLAMQFVDGGTVGRIPDRLRRCACSRRRCLSSPQGPSGIAALYRAVGAARSGTVGRHRRIRVGLLRVRVAHRDNAISDQYRHRTGQCTPAWSAAADLARGTVGVACVRHRGGQSYG